MKSFNLVALAALLVSTQAISIKQDSTTADATVGTEEAKADTTVGTDESNDPGMGLATGL